MSDSAPVTRREALIAATVLGVVSGIADAGTAEKSPGEDPSDDGPGQKHGRPQRFEIQVTLSDGEIVTLHPSELTIDFGAAGKLRVTPHGVLPGGSLGKNPKSKPGSDKSGDH